MCYRNYSYKLYQNVGHFMNILKKVLNDNLYNKNNLKLIYLIGKV